MFVAEQNKTNILWFRCFGLTLLLAMAETSRFSHLCTLVGRKVLKFKISHSPKQGKVF